jgi:2-keto-4-pentenoate hydratase
MLALAERLWEARRDGKVVRQEDIVEPVSTEEAYAIQSEIVRISGHEVRGSKSVQPARRLSGFSAPRNRGLVGAG